MKAVPTRPPVTDNPDGGSRIVARGVPFPPSAPPSRQADFAEMGQKGGPTVDGAAGLSGPAASRWGRASRGNTTPEYWVQGPPQRPSTA